MQLVCAVVSLVLLGRVGRAYYCLVHVCLSVCLPMQLRLWWWVELWACAAWLMCPSGVVLWMGTFCVFCDCYSCECKCVRMMYIFVCVCSDWSELQNASILQAEGHTHNLNSTWPYLHSLCTLTPVLWVLCSALKGLNHYLLKLWFSCLHAQQTEMGLKTQQKI